MTNMKTMSLTPFFQGRCFMGNIPENKDIIGVIEDFCKNKAISRGLFSVLGTATLYTTGTYDPDQEVYVTSMEKGPCEILSCTGNIFIENGAPKIRGSIALADHQGKVTGGRLFSKTHVTRGEIIITELFAGQKQGQAEKPPESA